MPVTGAFPYDLNNLLGGAVRVLYAPFTRARPTKPSEILKLYGSYNPQGLAYVNGAVTAGATSIVVNDGDTLPSTGTLYVPTQSGGITLTGKTGNTLTVTGGTVTANIPDGTPIRTADAWRDFGATREAFQYARNLEVGGYQIQQVTGNVMEEVTDTTRSARVSIAELNQDNLALLEEGTTASAGGAAGESSWDSVKFGTIAELDNYRIAFVARRAKSQGIVTEPGGVERGRFVVGVGFKTQLSADNVELGLARGELASAQVTFRFFPDTDAPNLTSGTEFGTHFIEKAGTIT